MVVGIHRENRSTRQGIAAGEEPSASRPDASTRYLRNPRGLHPSSLHPSGLHPSGLHPSGLHPSGLHPQPRGGFTLVELLVVIAIIGVLVGLLVVAIGRAQVRVREASMATEVKSMGQTLQGFKNQQQSDFPPDFSNPQTNKQVVDQFMSRMFRQRNPNTDVPREWNVNLKREEPNKLDPARYLTLDPAEALYFWLRGFTNDPQNPLFGPIGVDPTLVERSPFYEFSKAQLLDLDNDGFPEYYPRFANQRPYIYYVNYSYPFNFGKNEANLLCRIGPDATAVLPAPRPYLSTQVASPPNPMLRQHYAAPDSYQIIGAGLDNDYGVQVKNQNLDGYLPFAFPTGPYPDKPHRDNITSFVDATLEDALP